MPSEIKQSTPMTGRTLVYRQTLATRLTHWLWAIALFFLLGSGLQIFNAHPALYLGEQSGFGFDNTMLEIGAKRTDGGAAGYTSVLGYEADTTGLLGVSGGAEAPRARAFPAWATFPSGQNLATGRVIHFFFAWVFAFTLVLWLIGGLVSGHIRRNLLPTWSDIKALPGDIANHARLRFHHGIDYNVLQKLSYAGVLFILFPLMIATGLAMSPGVNASLPWLTDLFGGRQTARSLHFAGMFLLVLFFFVHILMIFAAGPINEIRSIVTGWYRVDARGNAKTEARHAD